MLLLFIPWCKSAYGGKEKPWEVHPQREGQPQLLQSLSVDAVSATFDGLIVSCLFFYLVAWHREHTGRPGTQLETPADCVNHVSSIGFCCRFWGFNLRYSVVYLFLPPSISDFSLLFGLATCLINSYKPKVGLSWIILWTVQSSHF